jgi:hypothetical protein
MALELAQRLQSRDMTQTAQEWLAAFAADVGLAAPTREEFGELLELAAIAAHASDRTAAPVTCWLAARAGLDTQAALAAGKRLAGEAEPEGA